MWKQPLEPLPSTELSVYVAAVPLCVLLVLMAGFRTSALRASICALLTTTALATWVWEMPADLAFRSVVYGFAYAVSPILWIVFSALVLYQLSLESGSFGQLRNWIRDHASADPGIQAILVAFCFGALLESCAGFGAPVAITAFLLADLGFAKKQAVVVSLVANTAPVGFGGMGLPVLALAGVTGLDTLKLSTMVGRQLPFLSVALPFYLAWIVGGPSCVKRIWPFALAAGGSYGLTQALVSTIWGPYATDILAAIASIAALLGLLALRRPEQNPDPNVSARPVDAVTHRATVTAWLPWIVLSVVMVLWSLLNLFTTFQRSIPVPGLHQKVYISLYSRPYAAIYTLQPLSVGTAVAVSAILSAIALRMRLPQFGRAVRLALRQVAWTGLTIVSIVSLAYLYNYSGMIYTLARSAEWVGSVFPFVSACLGWLGCFITGSDAASNLLFGNLQVAAARQLHLDPILLSATNSSGGVFGKIISPQNIAVGVTTVGLTGQEGSVLRAVFLHSIVLITVLSCLAYAQAYWLRWMVP